MMHFEKTYLKVIQNTLKNIQESYEQQTLASKDNDTLESIKKRSIIILNMIKETESLVGMTPVSPAVKRSGDDHDEFIKQENNMVYLLGLVKENVDPIKLSSFAGSKKLQEKENDLFGEMNEKLKLEFQDPVVGTPQRTKTEEEIFNVPNEKSNLSPLPDEEWVKKDEVLKLLEKERETTRRLQIELDLIDERNSMNIQKFKLKVLNQKEKQGYVYDKLENMKSKISSLNQQKQDWVLESSVLKKFGVSTEGAKEKFSDLTQDELDLKFKELLDQRNEKRDKIVDLEKEYDDLWSSALKYTRRLGRKNYFAEADKELKKQKKESKKKIKEGDSKGKKDKKKKKDDPPKKDPKKKKISKTKPKKKTPQEQQPPFTSQQPKPPKKTDGKKKKKSDGKKQVSLQNQYSSSPMIAKDSKKKKKTTEDKKQKQQQLNQNQQPKVVKDKKKKDKKDKKKKQTPTDRNKERPPSSGKKKQAITSTSLIKSGTNNNNSKKNKKKKSQKPGSVQKREMLLKQFDDTVKQTEFTGQYNKKTVVISVKSGKFLSIGKFRLSYNQINEATTKDIETKGGLFRKKKDNLGKTIILKYHASPPTPENNFNTKKKDIKELSFVILEDLSLFEKGFQKRLNISSLEKGIMLKKSKKSKNGKSKK